MEDTTKLDLGQLDAVLDVVAEMAAAARGDASGLLDVVARIDGLCDQLTAVRIELLHDADFVREPGLSVAERLHATNRVTRSASRRDARLATIFPTASQWLRRRGGPGRCRSSRPAGSWPG